MLCRTKTALASVCVVLGVLVCDTGLCHACVIWEPGWCPLCCPESYATTNGGCLLVCPAADGKTLADINSIVYVTVEDINGPFADIPGSDIWMIDADPERDLALCDGWYSFVHADSATNSEGKTTISGSMAAGGWGNGMLVVVGGCVMKDPAECYDHYLVLPIKVRSPDINADLHVNIADLALLAAAYPPAPYQERCDMNCDGVINVADLGLFATHYGPPGHQCQ